MPAPQPSLPKSNLPQTGRDAHQPRTGREADQPRTGAATPALASAWRDLRAREPDLRIRDAAVRLGVGEAALRATECGRSAIRLVDDWPAILRRLPLLGELLAVTRNEAAIVEQVGEYTEPAITHEHATIHGGPIDLRIFPDQWAHGFAVEEEGHRSLHFFDAHGDSVHKLYARERTEPAEFQMLVDIFRAEDQGASLELSPRPAKQPDRPDKSIDREALRADWLALEDTHDFAALLRKHGVSRTQALRLAPEGHARSVSRTSIEYVLDSAAACVLPIMIFVGNPGCLQIHTGPIGRLALTGAWLHVLDRRFNLHLRRDLVDQAWVVRKPTVDGIVTSLELFDAEGELIALLFGERKPGRKELAVWRELLSTIAPADNVGKAHA